MVDLMGDVGRSVLKGGFENLDPKESTIVIEGKSFRKVDPTPAYALTLLGSVEYFGQVIVLRDRGK